MQARRNLLALGCSLCSPTALITGVLTLPLAGSPPLLLGQAHAQPVAAGQEGQIIEGARLPLGRGMAVAWVALDARGVPESIGVDLTAAALDGLPDRSMEVTLAFPTQARQAGYDHMGLDWSPHGHEPPGVYDLPHFDVHFYRISVAERDQIVRDDPAFEPKMTRLPPSGVMPSGFSPGRAFVPRMGRHWGARDAPEFAGHTFDRTMLLGTYDGRLIFLEPMITRAFLLARSDVTDPIRAPELAEGTLWWPETYSISYRDGVHRIALLRLRPLPQR